VLLSAVFVLSADVHAGASDTDPPTPQAVTNHIGMKLVRIPPGEFVMGSPADEEERFNDEKQHRVRITRPFYLGVYEVTQGQYEKLTGQRPWRGRRFVKEGPDYPATYVSWEDAVAFCRRLSEKEGRTYRLPSEAEWEYACRAGSTSRYCFGESTSDLDAYAWFDKNALDVGEHYPHRVGQKRPNAWGLYDMHGNLFEKCSDWYRARHDAGALATDPSSPASGTHRVGRGGCWFGEAIYCRSAHRDRGTPGGKSAYTGFRVVLEAAE